MVTDCATYNVELAAHRSRATVLPVTVLAQLNVDARVVADQNTLGLNTEPTGYIRIKYRDILFIVWEDAIIRHSEGWF